MKPGSLLTLGLLALCAVLLAATSLLASGWVNDVDPIEPTQPRPLELTDLDNIEPFKIGEEDDFEAIAQRPIFNQDRRPKPIGDPGPKDPPPPPPTELDVAIGGIIITGDTKLALLTDNKTNTTMRVREGANLEGDLADWTLTAVEPRKLSFDGGSAGPVEVELQVNNRTMAAPEAPPTTVTTAKVDSDTTTVEDDASRAARAEEIRRRVAERRQQLRQEAARRRADREAESDN